MTPRFAAMPTGPYTAQEFSLGKMKFVVLDDDPTLVPKYVPYFEKAQHLLQSKGFGKVWYGTVFLIPYMLSKTELEIRAYEMAGYRRHFVENTAGFYRLGTDDMAFTQRVGPFLPYGVIHEMGHRLWFKSLSSEQRARFKSFLRFPHTPAPPKFVPVENASILENTFLGHQQPVIDVLAAFRGSRLAGINKILDTFGDPLALAGIRFGNDLSDVLHTTGATWRPEVKGEFDAALKAGSLVSRALSYLTDTVRDQLNAAPDMPPASMRKFFKTVQAKEVAKILGLLKDTQTAAMSYAQAVIKAHNAEEQRKQDVKYKGTGDVDPVTEYGASNIEEAFAEVFAKYVLGEDMSRDQAESFKAVLGKVASAESVAERFLLGLRGRETGCMVGRFHMGS